MPLRGTTRGRSQKAKRVYASAAATRRDQGSDSESNLRKRMRLHSNLSSSYPEIVPELIEPETDSTTDSEAAPRRRPIVSINGRDVDTESLDKRRTA
jgi:hypothetical protein